MDYGGGIPNLNTPYTCISALISHKTKIYK